MPHLSKTDNLAKISETEAHRRRGVALAEIRGLDLDLKRRAPAARASQKPGLLPFENGIWRMSHDGLARRIGLPHPKYLAVRIEAHEEWLSQISRLRSDRIRPVTGGRAWDQYWLTREQ